MRLFELAYCCRLYGEITRYDASIDEMRRVTPLGLDLHDEAHTKALLRWLNHWGCRQFAVDYHGEAGKMLGIWSDQWLHVLPEPQVSLAELDPGGLELAAVAYADLKDREASQRKLSRDRVSTVKVGPTGAAKILHALRPKALPPWDDPIRAALRFDASRRGYLEFLQAVQVHVSRIEAEAKAHGIAASEIPRVLGRAGSSLTKMIDEYYWVKITRGHAPPTRDDVARWHFWSQV